MLRILPDLSEDLLLRLYHKGAHVRWTSEDIDWEAPLVLSEREALGLARVLSPVYLGEQSAMLGAANVLPQLALAGEATAQLYLTTFLTDEARHFEVLTRLYRRMGQEPLSIRALPAMLRYHHRLRQGDRVDWVWGILISDLFAKRFYHQFAKSRPEALFGGVSRRIIVDESRHQAFCDAYLSGAMPQLGADRRRVLRKMRDDLLSIMEEMQDPLHADCDVLGFSGHDLLEQVSEDVLAHSRRVGLEDPPPDGGPSGVSDPVDLAARRAARESAATMDRAVTPPDTPLGGCAVCPLQLLCDSRIVRRAQAR